MVNPFIIGEKIYLRPLDISDAEICLGWINNPKITRTIYSGRIPMNLIAEKEWIENQARSQTTMNLAICLKANDLHVGNCGLIDINFADRRTTCGIIIGEPDYWDQGIGTEAMHLLVDHCFRRMNLHRVDLRVFDFNTRAQKAYKKVGFVEEGRQREKCFKDGRYVDEIMMSILSHEWFAANSEKPEN